MTKNKMLGEYLPYGISYGKMKGSSAYENMQRKKKADFEEIVLPN